MPFSGRDLYESWILTLAAHYNLFRLWFGLQNLVRPFVNMKHIVSSFVDSNAMWTISPVKLVAIIWLFHTYFCTYPGPTIDKAASLQNSCEKKASFNTSCVAFLIIKIDIHTFCLSKCVDNEWIVWLTLPFNTTARDFRRNILQTPVQKTIDEWCL